MARVTVEDCVTRIPNRFDLVMLAARRARDIAAGTSLTVDRDNDKNPVVALREIAEGTIDLAALKDEMIRGLQKHIEVDEPEEEAMELAPGEELSALAAAVAEEMTGEPLSQEDKSTAGEKAGGEAGEESPAPEDESAPGAEKEAAGGEAGEESPAPEGEPAADAEKEEAADSEKD